MMACCHVINLGLLFWQEACQEFDQFTVISLEGDTEGGQQDGSKGTGII